MALWDGSVGTIERSFDIMAFEASQLVYQQYTKKNPSARQCANCPVERVSWKDAVVFANALSKAKISSNAMILLRPRGG